MSDQPPSRPTARQSKPGSSMQAVLVVLIILFILFLWLNFVFTQQIVSTGYVIQERMGELNRIERQNDAILKDISVHVSQEKMAERAGILGYQPGEPVYIHVDQPIGQGGQAGGVGWPLSTPLGGERQSVLPSDPLWDMLGEQLVPVEVEPAP